MDVTFFRDPAAFLAAAGAYLAADPVRTSVLSTNAARCVRLGPLAPWAWFATVSDGDRVVGAAMRTHPNEPHTGFAGPMPQGAACALADALLERGEHMPGWNGDLGAAGELAASAAAAVGGTVAITEHLRLFELRQVIWPVRPAGELRPATPADRDLIAQWVVAFHHDADVQGGRIPQEREPDLAFTEDRIAQGKFFLWEVDGRPVHLLGGNPPSFGTVRIGPVFTPEAQRGKGYAGWAVATLSQRILDAGHRPCLYTDQANPVSNKVYERIGYEALCDEANHVVRTR